MWRKWVPFVLVVIVGGILMHVVDRAIGFNTTLNTGMQQGIHEILRIALGGVLAITIK